MIRVNLANLVCGPPRIVARVGLLLALAGLLAAPAPADWVTFIDQTATRMVATPGRGADDPEEKDYAWGDLDQDGDIDLVVARKQGWTTPGKRVAVLFLNENGVLTERTAEFATDSMQPGDQGFLTATNNRDIIVADVNNDGWLDLITGPTISPGDPKYVGHPRVYMNKGCVGPCNGTANWLGFRHEPARIPAMLSDSGQSGFNPCFCHADAGDVNGDGYVDLWFVDYDTGQDCSGPGDYNNKLLLNLGAVNPGFFVDATETTFGNAFQDSAFGASGWVQDVNGDGLLDLIKQFAGFIGVAYNKATNPFSATSSPYGGSAYFVSAGDLNKDNKLDLVVSDDGADRYLINQGNSGSVANFISFTYSYSHTGAGGAASDDGFSGDSIVADLNNDGWNDILITDVDVDIGGCDRRMHVYRNLGGSPGDDVIMQEQTTGSNCATFLGNPPSCLVGGMPASDLEGVHDVAVFDINGDGWQDLVVGRCSGTKVFVNQPPGDPAGGIDIDAGNGSQLHLGKNVLNVLQLTWGDSCITDDTDYAIYSGRLDAIGQHTPVVCSTAGANSQTVVPSTAENQYFLVVPHNGVFEGSYGKKSNGAERPAGAPSCRTQFIGPCAP
jgi:hypothetical protein